MFVLSYSSESSMFAVLQWMQLYIGLLREFL